MGTPIGTKVLVKFAGGEAVGFVSDHLDGERNLEVTVLGNRASREGGVEGVSAYASKLGDQVSDCRVAD